MKLSRFRRRRAVHNPTLAAPTAVAARVALQAAAGTATLSTSRVLGQRGPVAAADGPLDETQPDRWPGDGSTWLARARSFWQQGDWPALASLDPRSLQRHPDRARLALLAASGHFQLGDAAATRRCVRQAVDWGCDKRLVSQALVSGLHNTLGRAASVLNQPERALTHFAAAIATGSPGSPLRAVTQARGSGQLAQLGIGLGLASLEAPLVAPVVAPAVVAGPASSAAPTRAASQEPAGPLQAVGRLAIGPWPAGAAPQQRPATLVRGQRQWLAYAAGPRIVRVVQRQGLDGAVSARDLEVELDTGSAGAGIALGLDREGHLHLVYDSANQGSRWRRSTEAFSVRQWGPDRPMPGADAASGGLRHFAGGHDGCALRLVVQPQRGSHLLTWWAFDEPGLAWASLGELPAQAAAPDALACWLTAQGKLHLLVAASEEIATAPGLGAPGGAARVQLVHLSQAVADGGWRSTSLPSLSLPAADLQVQNTWALSAVADARNEVLRVLCCRSNGLSTEGGYFTGTADRWKGKRLPASAPDSWPLLPPAGMAWPGLVRCHSDTQHQVQRVTLDESPAPRPVPAPSLLFCRGLALAAMALPASEGARPGFTLVVHEQAGSPATSSTPSGLADTLALHDFQCA